LKILAFTGRRWKTWNACKTSRCIVWTLVSVQGGISNGPNQWKLVSLWSVSVSTRLMIFIIAGTNRLTLPLNWPVSACGSGREPEPLALSLLELNRKVKPEGATSFCWTRCAESAPKFLAGCLLDAVFLMEIPLPRKASANPFAVTWDPDILPQPAGWLRPRRITSP